MPISCKVWWGRPSHHASDGSDLACRCVRRLGRGAPLKSPGRRSPPTTPPLKRRPCVPAGRVDAEPAAGARPASSPVRSAAPFRVGAGLSRPLPAALARRRPRHANSPSAPAPGPRGSLLARGGRRAAEHHYCGMRAGNAACCLHRCHDPRRKRLICSCRPASTSAGTASFRWCCGVGRAWLVTVYANELS